jgi:hypothetical protein
MPAPSGDFFTNSFHTSAADPSTPREAFSCPDSDKWMAATDAEFKALKDLNVIQFVKKSAVPQGFRLLPSKLVFKLKKNPDGSIVQVPTADQLADILTKVLPRPKFQELRAQLMPPPVKFQ